MSWSMWIRGISPRKTKAGWFERDEVAFKALPTKGGGVYEIATGLDLGEAVTVYCGRATEVNPSARGVSLRRRLFSDYALSGGHKHLVMRQALEKGESVFFRWMILQSVFACTEMEAKLVRENDYVWNSAKVTSLADQLEKLCLGEIEAIEAIKKWAESKLKR